MNISQWIITFVAILIGVYLLPGVQATMLGALVFAVVLAIISLFIKPIIHVLTLPITVLTLGLFALVINALCILLGAKIVPGFSVDGFWWAVLLSIIISLVQSVFAKVHHK